MPKSHPTTNENRSSIESIENERGNVRDGKIETKTTMEWPRREKGTKEAEIEESWLGEPLEIQFLTTLRVVLNG